MFSLSESEINGLPQGTPITKSKRFSLTKQELDEIAKEPGQPFLPLKDIAKILTKFLPFNKQQEELVNQKETKPAITPSIPEQPSLRAMTKEEEVKFKRKRTPEEFANEISFATEKLLAPYLEPERERVAGGEAFIKGAIRTSPLGATRLIPKVSKFETGIPYEYLKKEKPAQTTAGETIGTIVSLMTLGSITKGVGTSILNKFGFFKNLFPTASRAISYGTETGITFGLQSLLEESAKQVEAEKFNPGRLAGKTVSGAGFGTVLGGTSVIPSTAKRIVTSGIGRGIWTGLETQVEKGKITKGDLLNVGANVVIGAAFSAMNAPEVTRRLKAEKIDDLLFAKTFTRLKMLNPEMSDKEATAMAKFFQYGLDSSPAYVEVLKNIPVNFVDLPKDIKYNYADSITKNLKAGKPVIESIQWANKELSIKKINLEFRDKIPLAELAKREQAISLEIAPETIPEVKGELKVAPSPGIVSGAKQAEPVTPQGKVIGYNAKDGLPIVDMEAKSVVTPETPPKPIEPTITPPAPVTPQEPIKAVAGQGIEAGKPMKKGYITVYHRTNASVDEIINKGFKSLENTDEIFVSSKKIGQAEGYGKNIIELQVKKSDLQLDDEFPSGEKHYSLPSSLATKYLTEAVKPIIPEAIPKEAWQMTQKENVTHQLNNSGNRKANYTYEKYKETLGDTVLQPLVDSHKQKVIKALSEGKPVPPEVLKDYPELQKQVIPKELEPLVVEARKYKSVGEFVNKQRQAFHGSAIKGLKDIEFGEGIRSNTFLGSTKIVKSGAIFFTPDKKVAQFFADNRTEFLKDLGKKGEPSVYERFLNIKNPADLTNISKAEKIFNDLGISIEEKILGTVPDYGLGASLEDLVNGGHMEINELWKLFDDKNIVEKFKKAGFDGALLKETGDRGTSYAIFNPKQAFTKQQLTDIWNKATHPELSKQVKPEITPPVEKPAKKVEPTEVFPLGKEKALKEITELISGAPSEKTVDKDKVGTVDIKLDGGFKIINTKEALTEFYARVKKTPKTIGAEEEKVPPLKSTKPTEDMKELVPLGKQGYFTDGSVIVKGEAPEKSKYQDREPMSEKSTDKLLNTKTEPAELQYYFVDQYDVKAKSDTPIKIEKGIEPYAVFKVGGKYVRYYQNKLNVITNRYPDATFGISTVDNPGMLLAYDNDNVVGGVMATKIGKGSVFLDKEPDFTKQKIEEVEPEKEVIQSYSPSETPAPQKVELTESPEIVKKSEIIKFLSEKLNVPIRRGHFRQRALGIFKTKAQIIRVKEGQLETVAHEVGHYLDATIPEVKALRKHSRELTGLTRSFPKSKQTSTEGIAEFIRLYITNRPSAKTQAPNYYNGFQKILSMDKYKEVGDILNVAEKDYKQWLSMPSVAKVKSQISFNPDKPKRMNYNDVYKALIDDLNPLDEYVKLGKKQGITLPTEDNPYILSRLFRGWVGRANHFLEYGTFNKELKVTGPGLKQILKPIDNKNALDDFSVYLISKRTLELENRDIETGINMEDARNSIQELEKKFPEFKEVAGKVYKYQNELMNYVKDSGLLDADTFDKIKELNKDYVPFYRVVEQLQRKGYSGKTFANISNPIKRIKGSEREIIDPIESILKNTYTLINNADRNNVGVAVVRLSTLDKELGRLVEEVPADMAKVADVKLSDVLSKSEISELNIPDEMLEKVIDVFRPSMFNKDNILTVVINGEKRFFQVDSDLYKAMLSLDTESIPLLIKILSYPARALRAGATLSPEFLGRNPFRDQMSAFIFSKYGYKPFIDVWGGVAEIFGKGQDFQLWLRSGGAHSMLISMDRNYIKKEVNKIFRNKLKLANPLEALRALSEIGEQATRIGEFKLAIKKGATPLEAAYASREVTLDFARHGNATKSLNMIVAFWNANVQGVDKITRAFKEQPKKTILAIVAGTVLPSALLYLRNRKSKRYAELARWQKDYFWIIDVGDKYPLIRIPKSFELGVLFGSGTERLLEWLDKRDPEAFDKYATNFIASFTPGVLPTALTPLIENYTNHSFFRNRPIESQSVQRLLPEERYYNYTPSTMKLLGKYTSNLTGWGPVKLENLIRGYFGGLGSLVMSLPDLAMKVTGKQPLPLQTADIPLIKGFIARDPYGFSSESVAKFYDDFEKVTQYYSTHKKYMLNKQSEQAAILFKAHPELKYFSGYQKFSNYLGKMRNKQEYYMDLETMTPEDRRRTIDDMNKLITEQTKKFRERVKEK